MNVIKFFTKHGKPKYAFEMIHHELKEAKHALKKEMFPTIDVIPDTVDDKEFCALYEEHIEDTFPDELASAGIKLMDFADSCNYNLSEYINMRNRYLAIKNGVTTKVTIIKPIIRHGMI